MGCFEYVWAISSKRRFAVKTVLFSGVDETVLDKNENGFDPIGKIFGFVKGPCMTVMAVIN